MQELRRFGTCKAGTRVLQGAHHVHPINANVLALVTVAAPAFAQSVFVGGAQGWVDHPVQSRVISEYLAFRKNQVALDGGQYVGGEAGYGFPQHTYAYQNGEWVCTDTIAHNPAPASIKTTAERVAFKVRYPA
ncbi:hypothetical protein RAMLITH_17175 [Ramlibacter sp. RBP-2]|uniref:Uncharacterized protein n=1 Tax=Ramlibacter lithotrophicus TaxID=2606681 RepID=A0A7X6DI15_9BURK|nr:hypothetical protein [Ramlibacter lithotrophicus]NKE67557.1 hypothetical protein [Ramlibacter lithotrophicus]